MKTFVDHFKSFKKHAEQGKVQIEVVQIKVKIELERRPRTQTQKGQEGGRGEKRQCPWWEVTSH